MVVILEILIWHAITNMTWRHIRNHGVILESFVYSAGGCSAHYSPHQIPGRRNVDFNKEFEFSFGSYVIVSQENKPLKNNIWPHGRDCIYLRASKSLQGGHRVLDLVTGRVIEWPKVKEVKLTDLVVERVEEGASVQAREKEWWHGW